MSIIRVAVESSLATEAVNVWHFEIADVAPVTEAQGAVDALEDFYDAIKTYLVAGVLTIGDRVVTVDQTPNTVIAATSRSVTTSGATTTALSVAPVLKLITPFVGPRYRGRVFLGPVEDAFLNSDGRTLGNTPRTLAISSAVTHLLTNLTTADLVVYSRKFNTAQTVTGFGMDTIAGTQRRRMR